VDGLRNVDDPDLTLEGAGDPRRRERGVVAADRQQVADAELAERVHHPLPRPPVAGGVRAGGAQDRAALEVDPGDAADLERRDPARGASQEPADAVLNAEHAEP